MEQAALIESIVRAFGATASYQLHGGSWVFELRPGVLWFPSRRPMGWIVKWAGECPEPYVTGTYSIYPIRRRFNHTAFAKFCDAIEQVFGGRIPESLGTIERDCVSNTRFEPATVFIDRGPRVVLEVASDGDVQITRSIEPIDEDSFSQAFDPPLHSQPSGEQARWMGARLSQMKMYATFGSIIGDVAQFWDFVATRRSLGALLTLFPASPD